MAEQEIADLQSETPPVGDEESRTPATPEPADAVVAERRDASPELEFRQRRAEMLRGTIEHRDFDIAGLECRTLDDGTIRMTGVASVTERWYDIGDPKRGGFRERIVRGGFKRTLGETPDTVLLGNHEGWPMARTRNGSLAMAETARGLQWDADLDSEDPESKVVARKVEKGLVDQCSFAFQCTDDSWNDDFTERTIRSVSLHRGDVSIVTFGANDATTVSTMRSADGSLELRAGKSISSANQAQLQRVLDLIASADDAVDEAQPILAEVLGVANPDADDAEPDADDSSSRAAETPEPTPLVIPDYTTRARERLAAMRRAS